MRCDRPRPARWAPLAGAALLAALGGCADDEIVTTTRNLRRPGPLALVCVGRVGEDQRQAGLTLEHCVESDDQPATGTLFGLVANTARVDVAVFRTSGSGEPLVDLDRGSPGFGFIPVGSLPSDLEASGDGCRALTANSGSCDLSLIDVPGALSAAAGELARPAAGVASRVIPRTVEGPLGARPHEVLFVPASVPDKGEEICPAQGGSYRAYVTFPSCNLVAEIDLATGLVVQGMVFDADGVTFTTSPRCATECGPRSVPDAGADLLAGDAGVDLAADGAPPDGAAAGDTGGEEAGAGDAGVDVAGGSDGAPPDSAVDGPVDGAGEGPTGDGAPSDGAPGDSGGEIASGGVLPTSIAIADGQLVVSSAGAGFLTVVDVAEDGRWFGPRRIPLAGERAQTTRIKISPPTTALGRFVYAIAKDGTVRVVSLELEQECETNVDLALLGEELPLSQARCMPVGGQQAPRRVTAAGPGIGFGSRLPRDIAFATVSGEAESDGEVPEATPLRGVFAFVATSDGNVFAIDLEDENYIDGSASTVPTAHLPHRLRNALQGDEDNGAVSTEVASVTGGDEGGVPVIVTELGGEERGVLLRAPGEVVSQEWTMQYEPRLTSRATGQLRIKDGQLLLADVGAEFCRAGVLGRQLVGGRPQRHGDIVAFLGCDDDDDCGLRQICRKVVGDQDRGLCFDEEREEQLFSLCRPFLGGARELLVRRASRGELVLDVLPVEPQRVIKQQPQPPGGCQQNEDCEDGFLCALADRVIDGRPEASLAAGECFRSGCTADSDCPTGNHCVAPLDGSPRVCSPIPLPLDLGPSCTADEQCRPQRSGGPCEQDADCDPAAECRRASSAAEARVCVDRGWVCADFPGLKDRCVRPTVCLEQLQLYEVLAGRSLVLGARHRVIADEATDECRVDETQDPLLGRRLPIGMPVFPVVLGPRCQSSPTPLATPEPNPCFERAELDYEGYAAKGAAVGERTQKWVFAENGAATLLHFATPELWLTLGLSHLVALPEEGAGFAPMPERGLVMELEIKSGFSQLYSSAAATAISLPAAMVTGPDGLVYVADMGDTGGNTATAGQVVRFKAEDLVLQTFRVK